MKRIYLKLIVLFTVLTCFNYLNATVIDVSSLIINNDFTGSASAWTTASAAYSSFSQASGTFEAYNAANTSSWFVCKQTISVPAGVYRLTAGAFHRSGNNFTNVILYGTTTKKEYSVNVKTLASETAAYGSTPNSRTTAKTAFNAGYWINTVENIVVEDEGGGNGSLEVGIRNIGQPPLSGGNIWTIWSNFKLYRLEGADLNSLRALTITRANLLLAELTDYNDGGALATAIVTLAAIEDASLTINNIKTLEAEMLSYRNNRMAFASKEKPADVTHLIKNPGFEDGQVSKLGTANGHYCEPKGWTLAYNTASTHVNNNVTIVNNATAPAGFATVTSLVPTEGNYIFHSRYRWTTNETMTISQTVSGLQAGTYKLSADLGKTSTNSVAYFKGTIGSTDVLNATATYTSPTGLTKVNATFLAKSGDNLVITGGLVQSGNVEATILLDNIKLEYLGNVPVLAAVPASLYFNDQNTIKTFNVSGGNLTENAIITAPTGITLDKTSLTPDQVFAGATVTATFDKSVTIFNGQISITSGTLTQNISVEASSDGLCYTPEYSTLTNLIPDPYMNDLSKYGGWGNKSIVSDPAQVYCGSRSGFINGTALCYPNSGSIDASIAWKPNTSYQIVAMVKAVNGTMNIGVSNVGLGGDVNFEVPQSDSWTKFSTTFKTGATAANGLCFFNGCGASTGYIGYIDNWQIYELPTLNAPVNDEDNGRMRFTSVGQTLEVPVTATGFTNGFTVSSDNDKFEVQTPTLPAAGGNVSVRFIGTLVGQYSGTLTIQSQNSAAPAPGMKKVAGAGTKLEIPMVADITTGVGYTSTKDSKVFISGNNVIAQFTLNAATQVEMNVYNVNGLLMASEKQMFNAGSNQIILNTNIANGVYFVKLNIDGETSTTKLVK